MCAYLYIHAQTHTHTRTHRYTHAQSHTHTRVCTHAYPHMPNSVLSHNRTCRIHTHVYTHIPQGSNRLNRISQGRKPLRTQVVRQSLWTLKMDPQREGSGSPHTPLPPFIPVLAKLATSIFHLHFLPPPPLDPTPSTPAFAISQVLGGVGLDTVLKSYREDSSD